MNNHFMADGRPSYIYLATASSTVVKLFTSDSLDPVIKSKIDKTVRFTSELKIALPSKLQGQILQKEAKAVRIRSNKPISVMLFDNDYQSSDDSSMILPTDQLSTSYMVVSTPPLLPQNPVYSSVFGIASLNDDTFVTIKFKLLDNSYPITINGKNYSDSDTLGMSMNKLETFQVGHNTDLTGTTIESSKPVAVFSGNRCNMLPGSLSCSHMMEQLPPISKWTNLYVVPPDFNSNGSLIRVLSQTDTPLYIYNGSDLLQTSIKAGIPYDINITFSKTLVINTRTLKPLLVANFVRGNQINMNAGDPYMVLVPGYWSYRYHYRLMIPDGYLKNYITVMMVRIRNQNLPFLLINGQSFDPKMAVFRDTLNYYGAYFNVFTFEVSPGLLDVRATEWVPFALIINGYRSMDAYGCAGNILQLY